MFRARKDHMSISVGYENGRVIVTSMSSDLELERAHRMIAQSEQLIAQTHMDKAEMASPSQELMTFFRGRGWIISG